MFINLKHYVLIILECKMENMKGEIETYVNAKFEI